jgi:hypothetical protein
MAGERTDILLLGHDILDSVWIVEQLWSAYSGSIGIERIQTEDLFLQSLSRIVCHPPHVIISEVVIGWTLSQTSPEPEGYEVRHGMYCAGFECRKRLFEQKFAGKAPEWIFFTGYDLENFTEITDVPFVQKIITSIPKLIKLIDATRSRE